jgi:hypothetical protein
METSKLRLMQLSFQSRNTVCILVSASKGDSSMSELSNMAQHAQASVHAVAQRTAPAVRVLARLGFAARGCIFCLVGTLAAMTAIGARGARVTDTRGALETIVSQPFGRAILAIIAVGFFAFALWQVVVAIEDPDRRGNGWRGIFPRIGAFFGALMYLSLMVSAIHVVLGEHVASSEHTTRDWTAWAMSLPLGRIAVAIIGTVIIIVGFLGIRAAAKRDIGQRLDHQKLHGRARKAAIVVGRIGIASRGLIFCLIGGFLLVAAWHANPHEAHGLAGALHYVELQPYGPWLLATVAVGFVAYGAFEFIEARYRRVDPG